MVEKEQIIMDAKAYIDLIANDLYKNLEVKTIALQSELQGLRDSVLGTQKQYDGINAKLDALLMEMKHYRPIVKQLSELYSSLFSMMEAKENDKENKGKLGFKKDSGAYKIKKEKEDKK